jgi:hypothetical protein
MFGRVLKKLPRCASGSDVDRHYRRTVHRPPHSSKAERVDATQPRELAALQESGPLKRFLLIFNDLIFDSSVDRGMPSLVAAPEGPYTRPPHSRKAASIADFSCSGSRLKRLGWTFRSPAEGGRESQLSSTENVCDSHTITDRSITFCNSRTLPGHVYDCSRSRLFLSIDVKCLPAFRAYRFRK